MPILAIYILNGICFASSLINLIGILLFLYLTFHESTTTNSTGRLLVLLSELYPTEQF